jgi:hypothetical protein
MQPSKKMLWSGRVISALPVLFLLWDSAGKLMKLGFVAEAFDRMGYPVSTARGIGLLELACVAVYLIPRTSYLGAILLTGFLGGATATHVRVGDPFFSHTFFPTYVGLMMWCGLFLRDARLQALLTLGPLARDR